MTHLRGSSTSRHLHVLGLIASAHVGPCLNGLTAHSHGYYQCSYLVYSPNRTREAVDFGLTQEFPYAGCGRYIEMGQRSVTPRSSFTVSEQDHKGAELTNAIAFTLSIIRLLLIVTNGALALVYVCVDFRSQLWVGSR